MWVREREREIMTEIERKYYRMNEIEEQRNVSALFTIPFDFGFKAPNRRTMTLKPTANSVCIHSQFC